MHKQNKKSTMDEQDYLKALANVLKKYGNQVQEQCSSKLDVDYGHKIAHNTEEIDKLKKKQLSKEQMQEAVRLQVLDCGMKSQLDEMKAQLTEMKAQLAKLGGTSTTKKKVPTRGGKTLPGSHVVVPPCPTPSATTPTISATTPTSTPTSTSTITPTTTTTSATTTPTAPAHPTTFTSTSASSNATTTSGSKRTPKKQPPGSKPSAPKKRKLAKTTQDALAEEDTQPMEPDSTTASIDDGDSDSGSDSDGEDKHDQEQSSGDEDVIKESFEDMLKQPTNASALPEKKKQKTVHPKDVPGHKNFTYIIGKRKGWGVGGGYHCSIFLFGDEVATATMTPKQGKDPEFSDILWDHGNGGQYAKTKW
jgi:hypothetical protein